MAAPPKPQFPNLYKSTDLSVPPPKPSNPPKQIKFIEPTMSYNDVELLLNDTTININLESLIKYIYIHPEHTRILYKYTSNHLDINRIRFLIRLMFEWKMSKNIVNDYILYFKQYITQDLWTFIVSNTDVLPEIDIIRMVDATNINIFMDKFQIPQDILIKYSDIVDWKKISQTQSLTPDFIERYIDKLDMNELLYNSKIHLSHDILNEHTRDIFIKTPLIKEMPIFTQDNDCPLNRQPIGDSCPEEFPYKFTTIDGNDCCARKRKLHNPRNKGKFKRLDIQQYLDAYSKSTFNSCYDLYCYINADIDKDCTSKYKNMDPYDFILELSIRSIPYTTTSDVCKKLYNELPSIEWLEAQKQYNLNLPDDDKKWIELYSHNGDTILNSYLRGQSITRDTLNYIRIRTETFSKYFDVLNMTIDTILVFLQTFHINLSRIIHQAPRLQEKIIVYRGLQNADFFVGTPDHLYTNKGYVSTSIYGSMAYSFSNGQFMNQIIIHENYPCLLMYHSRYTQEFEILLPHNSMYYITKPFQGKLIVDERIRLIQMNECVLVKVL